MKVKENRKRQRQQLRQFEQFFESFSNSEEARKAAQQGVLSTDRKFTQKILHQLALEEDKKQAAEEAAKHQDFLKTCQLAGVEAPPSPSKGKPKTPKHKEKKMSLKERELEKQQAVAVAQLLLQKEAVLPWPFDDLLLLQNYDGRWLDVEQIYECLGIPSSNYFTNGNCTSLHSLTHSLTN